MIRSLGARGDAVDGARVLGEVAHASRALAGRPVRDLARVLGAVGRRLSDPSDALRAEALQRMPLDAGFSDAMAREVLDGMAPLWTEVGLTAALERDFPDPAVLDGFVPVSTPVAASPSAPRFQMAVGESPALHVSSGNVPGVGVTTLLRGLLVKSGVVLKPGVGDLVLPELAARALGDVDPDLASAFRVVRWEHDSAEAARLVASARFVVAYGGDAGIAWVRRHLGPRARLISFPHRLSAAWIRPEARTPEVARVLARSVAAFDQRGCVSPHTVWVEGRDADGTDAFARALAEAMEVTQERIPRGHSGPGVGSAFAQTAGVVELQEASGEPVTVLGHGQPWRVVVDRRPGFRVSCAGRFVWLRPVDGAAALVEDLATVGSDIQTLAVAGRLDPSQRHDLTLAGVRRWARLEGAAWPGMASRHDGTPALASLVRWVDDEGAGPGEG